MILHLPYPPSMNHYWRSVSIKGRYAVLISRDGRKYREHIDALVKVAVPITVPLSVHILVARPDRRRRDLDNLLKPLLDALAHAGVYDDDSQIEDLRIAWTAEGSGVVVDVRDLRSAAGPGSSPASAVGEG